MHWGIVLSGKIMILQGVRHPMSCLGVCYAKDPASALAVDPTMSLRGDFWWPLVCRGPSTLHSSTSNQQYAHTNQKLTQGKTERPVASQAQGSPGVGRAPHTCASMCSNARRCGFIHPFSSGIGASGTSNPSTEALSRTFAWPYFVGQDLLKRGTHPPWHHYKT